MNTILVNIQGNKMKTRMINKTELKRKIAVAYERAKKTRDDTADSDNRQVEETHLQASSSADTLFAILDALNGRTILLNILAGE